MAEKAETEIRETGKEVEISFGTLIKINSKLEPGRIDVIDDVGREGYEGFYSGKLHHPDDETERWFFPAGTTLPKDVEEVVGQLTEGEVLAAADRGWREHIADKNSPKKFIEQEAAELENRLKKAAQKGPRKIKIKI